MPINCLNCKTDFTGNFCPNCAQKASTKRFTLRQVFSSDFLQETLNLNRGLLHTCWHLIIRPGYMVQDYLGGKRKKYFNFIGFLVIMLAIELVLWQFGHNSVAQVLLETMLEQYKRTNPDAISTLALEDVETMLRNQKISFLVIIPFAAVGSWLVLRRTSYNYAEHIVAVTFLLAMNTLLGFGLGALAILPLPYSTFKIIYYSFSVIVLGYGLWFYWQFSQKAKYTKGGRTWRVIAAYLMVALALSLGQQFFMGAASGNRMAGEEAKIEAPDMPK